MVKINISTPASPYYSPSIGRLRSASLDDTEPDGSLSNISILVTAFLAILATGGPTYSFGVYANSLKTQLSLTQSQLDTLGAASFAAGLISWIPGLCVDSWGSRKALIVGGLLQSLGLILYWAVARYLFEYLPPQTWIPTLSTLSVLIFTSNNLVIGGVFKSMVVSVGLGNKGKAVGAGKAYLGLGAGVFSCVFRSLHHSILPSDLDFLVMCSVVALIFITGPAVFGLPTKEAAEKSGMKDESSQLHYNVLYGGLAVLALLVVGQSAMLMLKPLPKDGAAIEDGTDQESFMPDWAQFLLLVLFWVGPVFGLFLVPTQSKQSLQKKLRMAQKRGQEARKEARRQHLEGTPELTTRKQYTEKSHLLDKNKVVPNPTLTAKKKTSSLHNIEQGQLLSPLTGQSDEAPEEICETPQPVEDLTLTEMLRTFRAWLFLASATVLVGSGTVLTINMGQMVQSLGFANRATAACLALFSVAQALARVASGAVSESALQWPTRLFGLSKGVPRTFFLVVCCALAMVGHSILATTGMGQREHFVVGILFCGLSFGGLWPLMVLIMGDLFGTVNHGANYMFADGFTCAVGTLAIAKFLAQSVYEAHTLESDDVSSSCFGQECFHVTHITIALLCCASLFASVALLYLTRSSYGIVISN